MIRAPLANSLLSATRTAQQLLVRRNAFDEAVVASVAKIKSPGATGNHRGATSSQTSALELRSLSSSVLWLLACARAGRAVSRAVEVENPADAQAQLTRLGELLRFGEVLNHLGVLGTLKTKLCRSFVEGWYDKAIRDSLARGIIVPGSTCGVPARKLLHVRVEKSTADLMKREEVQRNKYEILVQKGLAGQGHLDLNDEDLTGLTENMKSIWASSFGSAAVWRSKKYKVPVGHDAMNRIMPFCQNAATRRRLFEAHYANFGTEVHGAALELLRARKELAERLGFNTWAEYELKPLVVGDPSTARQLLDSFWRDAEPALVPVLRRMEELGATAGLSSSGMGASAKGRKAGTSPRIESSLPHPDAAFIRALVTREADTWRLAEFLPAAASLPRILDIVGRAYNVTFQEVRQPELAERLRTGWHRSVRIYEVTDGPPDSAIGKGGRTHRELLGFVYLDLYQRQTILGRPLVALAGAIQLCSGHAYVSMNLPAAGYGQNKLLNPEEVVAMAHELGHAVHMLCHSGSFQEFQDLPLDILELPSTLAETIALQPGIVAQYARHYASGGPPPDSLVLSCQRDTQFFIRCLQSASVVLGIHGEGFDPHASTPEDLREATVAFWQRYSPFSAHPGFTPLGEDAGLHVAQGATHIAYLLCYLRVDAILHGQSPGSQSAGKRWLTPDFAKRIRSQLLDRNFPGQRLAALLPPLKTDHGEKGSPTPVLQHPLPPPPSTAAGLLARAAHGVSAQR